MKKINKFSKYQVFAFILALAGAYVFRVGFLNNDLAMYVVGVLLFVAAYIVNSKQKQ